ncbi:hypothetical protein [Gordonia aichiensis]
MPLSATRHPAPGTRLTVSCPEDRLILVRATTDGSVQVTRAGSFRVPVRKRRRGGLLQSELHT